MFPYIPTINDDVISENKKLFLPNSKLIQLMEIIYFLDKRYKIEKIISFNDENYQDLIKKITKNDNLELHNHLINNSEGYFHITFEKELIKDDKNINYDHYCPYAISLVIDGNIERDKYQELFNKYTMR